MQKISIYLLFTVLSIVVAISPRRESRKLSAFTKISFHDIGELYLTQGSTQKVEIEADRDILEKIKTEVIRDRLVIEFRRKWFEWFFGWTFYSNRRINCYVTVPNITDLSVNGSGKIIGLTKVFTDDIKLCVSGSGLLSVNVEARNLEASVLGSGIMAVNGKCKNITSDLGGSGEVDLSINVAAHAEFNVHGSGRFVVAGTSPSVAINLSGSGKVLAVDFEADSAKVEISGSGDVKIGVKDKLSANIMGSGSIFYKGNPSTTVRLFSGKGKVMKL